MDVKRSEVYSECRASYFAALNGSSGCCGIGAQCPKVVVPGIEFPTDHHGTTKLEWMFNELCFKFEEQGKQIAALEETIAAMRDAKQQENRKLATVG